MAVKWNMPNDLSSSYRQEMIAPTTRVYGDLPRDLSPYARLQTLDDSVRRAGSVVQPTILEPSVVEATQPQRINFTRLEHSLLDLRHVRKAGD